MVFFATLTPSLSSSQGVFSYSALLSVPMDFVVVLPALFEARWLVIHSLFYPVFLVAFYLYLRLIFSEPGVCNPAGMLGSGLVANKDGSELTPTAPVPGPLSVATLRAVAHGDQPANVCAACVAYKPMRARHCPACDACVLRTDRT